MAKRKAVQATASVREYLPRKAKGDIEPREVELDTVDPTPQPRPQKRQKRQKTKATPRKKTAILKPAPPPGHTCVLCSELKPVSAFPPIEHIRPSCQQDFQRTHLCQDCMERSFKMQFQLNSMLALSCPLCGRAWEEEYLRFYMTEEELFKHIERMTYRSLERDPSFRWCARDECISGQMYDAEAAGNDPKTCCGHCESVNCFNCRVVWHNGLTCDEFQDPKKAVAKKKALDKGADNDTLKTMKKNDTKRCPHCMVAIEKTMGCDHMYCGSCGREFTWVEAKAV